MTAAARVAVAQVAISTAQWHALHARYQSTRLADVRQCAGVAIRQLERALQPVIVMQRRRRSQVIR